MSKSRSNTEDVVTSTSTTTPREHIRNFARSTSIVFFGDKAGAGGQKMTVEDVLSNFHVRQYCPWEIVPEGGSRFRAYIQSDHTPAAERMMLGLFTSREHAQSACAQQSPVVWLDEKLDENRRCKLCQAGFALLRRVHHCRNCGACVCAECSSVSWPNRMVPPTYVHVGEKRVRVCDACHFFFERFRKSLLEGNIDEVVATYSTGNCNLVCPFALYEGNHFPLHAAAQGGSLDVVKFLVEVELVPLYFVRGGETVPYTTSSGMTVLALAAREKAMDIVRYLVTERRVQMDQVQDVKDLQDMCSWLLREVWGKEGEKGGGKGEAGGGGGYASPAPAASAGGGGGGGDAGTSAPAASAPPEEQAWTRHLDPQTNLYYLYNNETGETTWEDTGVSRESDGGGGKAGGYGDAAATASAGGDDDEGCVVCFDAAINSVFVECGHVVTCFACGSACDACPMCRVKSRCVKTFSK